MAASRVPFADMGTSWVVAKFVSELRRFGHVQGLDTLKRPQGKH
ncbi:hypothetical protein ARZXY2_1935 [Arthrobacter sp. ZXY-2]|nr:hypothetical protein ARZXY2_1935 [Arthrobacter sp. ZXY-2]